MTQTQHTRPPYRRLWAAIGLGATATAVSVLLMAADAISGSTRWAHHPGISAAPLLLIAVAIAAGSLAYPRQGRRLMPFIAVLAFTSWGLAQLFPGSAAGYLNDTAILLFVTDAAYAVASHARNAPSASSGTAPEPAGPTHTRHHAPTPARQRKKPFDRAGPHNTQERRGWSS